jgi:ATP-binding cassette, subfamily B, bacterial
MKDAVGGGQENHPAAAAALGSVVATQSLRLGRLLRPYWKLLAIAFAAMLIEGLADLLEPWPLKVIFDHVIGARPMPPWLSAWPLVGRDRLALLNAAALAVIVIAVIGAVSAYAEKWLSTAVGQRVTHDLRHMLYHHVQRLSLSFYEHRQTGDMVVRLTSDIDAAQDFISSALLGMLLDVFTLVGMLAVMFYLDWRFSLIALSVVIFVMDDGAIVERGSREQLPALGGLYARLHGIQFRALPAPRSAATTRA